MVVDRKRRIRAKIATQKVVLHTLHARSFEVYFNYTVSGANDALTPYDCTVDALFCMNASTAYSRDIFDLRVFQAACLGDTFRNAYELSHQKSRDGRKLRDDSIDE